MAEVTLGLQNNEDLAYRVLHGRRPLGRAYGVRIGKDPPPSWQATKDL